MKVALFGYGKMGKEIEQILLNRGHSIVAKVSRNTDKNSIQTDNIDVVIEFSTPEAVVENIAFCLAHKLPIVIGTTGWYDHFDQLSKQSKENDTAMIYGTNFSIGVNLFFTLNSALAQLMTSSLDYSCEVKEIHHTEKKDAPSGTGITIAEDIIENNSRYTNWLNVKKTEISDTHILPLASERLPDVPGTHIVTYENEIDKIEITHTAKNRKGFALGSVLAAEWIINKKGIFSIKEIMPDLIKEII